MDYDALCPAHVRAARAVLKLTAKQLAESAGVKRSTLALYESGRWRAPRDFEKAIADALYKKGVAWELDEDGTATLHVDGGAILAAELPDRSREFALRKAKAEG